MLPQFSAITPNHNNKLWNFVVSQIRELQINDMYHYILGNFIGYTPYASYFEFADSLLVF